MISNKTLKQFEEKRQLQFFISFFFSFPPIDMSRKNFQRKSRTFLGILYTSCFFCHNFIFFFCKQALLLKFNKRYTKSKYPHLFIFFFFTIVITSNIYLKFKIFNIMWNWKDLKNFIWMKEIMKFCTNDNV